MRFSENFNKFIETNPVKPITEEDLDDRKVVLDRLLKKNPDMILPGVNFPAVQSALQSKEQISD